MIHLLSPAKSLDFETAAATENYSVAEFQEYSEKLINKARTFSRKKLSELMGISSNLADLNHGRYQQWETVDKPGSAKQAVLSFTGDVYRGLDAKSLSDAELDFAQSHLRILSGLYGLLKPLDLILPYRLEMGTNLPVGRKKNLYDFWGSTLTDRLNDELELHEEKVIVNLASNEYFKAIKPKELKGEVVSPQFKDAKNGQYKSIMTFAKLARGYMSRFIIQNKVDKVKDIYGFDSHGYVYNPKLSSPNEPVFTREENQR